MVLNWLKSRRTANETAKNLYLAAATQARAPAFYQSMGVPDSIDGRFEMTALHVFMVMNVLKKADSKDAGRICQAVFDHMFRLTDQTIREAGIGDLSVPRHMKQMMKAFNGRAHAYHEALKLGTPKAMKDALRRNVYGTVDQEDSCGLDALAHYVRASLENMSAAVVMTGSVQFAPLGEDVQGQEVKHYG